MKYNLYVIVERHDGTLLTQRICKMEGDEDHEFIRKKIKDYLRMIGDYYLIDWYINV